MSTGVQTAIGQIGWHTLLTTDVEQAKSFYGELLGWDYEVFKPGEMDVPVISQNGQMHGGIQPVRHEGTPPHWHGYVHVEDLASTIGKVESGGGKTLVPAMPIPDVGKIAVFADPQGAVFAATEAAGEMQVPTGTFLWDELLATDVEAAKRFYTSVFDWTTVDRDMGDMVYTLLKRAGDVDVGGLMRKPDDSPGPAAWLTYLATGDVDATVAKAKKLGGSVFMEGMDIPEVGRFAVIADPTGAVVGLFSPNG
jgi:predicted enzyme related to lactoylglutathione lyase